ncbi:MAG TPA: hypothetical protein VGM88_19345 [Kofleriaceae bacterium]
MRTAIALGFVLLVGACGTDKASNSGGGGDDVTGDDQPGSDGGGADADPYYLAPPTYGFQIKGPDIDLMPSQEITYCYYFHTPNTQDMAIQSWESKMTPGSHHLIFFQTDSNSQADGTLTTDNCGLTGGGLNLPVWTFSAQTEDALEMMPQNDGNGTPVGQTIPAGKSGYIQMHYLNATDNEVHAHVTVNANAYPQGTTVTPAAPFVTFNTNINIPAEGMASAAGECTVPTDKKFFLMTTHSHKQSVETMVYDGGTVATGNQITGGTMVVDSTDWEHPSVTQWSAMPFYQFTNPKLGYQCNYVNPNNYDIHEGDSAARDEMCMAVGYFFPSTDAKICLNSTTIN